jgi:endonuclease-8
MEGPSVKVITEKLAGFVGKMVTAAAGNARIEKEIFQGKEIKGIFSRGKNLVITFPDFTVKLHFLMYGSYRINEERVGVQPRLALRFDGDEMLNFYNCSVRILNTEQLEELNDEAFDILSENWKPDKVLEYVSKMKEELICDVLLDQKVFAGVGNIIKNEALFMAKLHPLSTVENIAEEKLKEVILSARAFSERFYDVRKRDDKLNTHLQIYRKKQCPVCNEKIIMKRTGKRLRISFCCPSCQILYA